MIDENMVERVARAAYTAHKPRNKPWETIGAYERGLWLSSARSAIEAMTIPIVDMKDLG